MHDSTWWEQEESVDFINPLIFCTGRNDNETWKRITMQSLENANGRQNGHGFTKPWR
jgi:hypothetical protein